MGCTLECSSASCFHSAGQPAEVLNVRDQDWFTPWEQKTFAKIQDAFDEGAEGRLWKHYSLKEDFRLAWMQIQISVRSHHVLG